MMSMQSSSERGRAPAGQPTGVEHSRLLKNGAAPGEIGADYADTP
jgi:hypothetical protein